MTQHDRNRADLTVRTAFAVIYRPEWSEQLFRRLVKTVEELAAPADQDDAIAAQRDSTEGRASAKRSFDELLKSTPEAEKKLFFDALNQPFQQGAANALRAHFDAVGAEAQRRWGALVAMAIKSGTAKWNGNQVRALCRTSWAELALRGFSRVGRREAAVPHEDAPAASQARTPSNAPLSTGGLHKMCIAANLDKARQSRAQHPHADLT